MGLSIAISGGITATALVIILGIIFSISYQINTESLANTDAFEINNSILKTDFKINLINSSAGLDVFSFVLNNTGSEKLWNFEKYNVIASYDADISGKSTRVTENLSFVPKMNCRTEDGTTNIPSTDTLFNATLKTPIFDTSKAFLHLDMSGTQGGVRQGAQHMVSGFITNNTHLTFQRGAASTNGDPVEISYALVECFNDEFDVQRGEILLSGAALTNTDIINQVDTSRSIVLVNSRTAHAANAEDRALVTGELTDSTTILAERAVGGSDTTVRYEVITFSQNSGISVQTNEVNLGSGSQNVIDNLGTNIDMSRTWLYCSWDASNNGLRQTAIGCELSDVDEITFHRYASSAFDNRIRYYVIEFPADMVKVQRNSVLINPGTPGPINHDIDFPDPVNSLSRAVGYVTHTTLGTGTAFPRNQWVVSLLDSDTIRTTFWNPQGGTADTNTKFWQVIEFLGSSGQFGNVQHFNDHLDPKIVNSQEAVRIFGQLDHPIFQNGVLEITVSADNGKVDTNSIIIT